MALPTAAPATEASPQLIGNAFVQQYYLFLHQSPEQVHKFYLDSSILCRPDHNGVMTSVATIQAINEMILSLDFRNCFVEIETVDTQISFKNAILIVVTGSVTSKENIRRKFIQSFFLAPQEKGGYFVQNDILRFLNRIESDDIFNMFINGSIDNAAKDSLVNGANDNDAPEVTLSNGANDNVGSKAPLSTDTESSSLDLLQTTSTDEGADNNELLNPSENGGSGVLDDTSIHPPLVAGKDAKYVPETMPSTEDSIAKKSYASIVKVVKGNPVHPPVYVPVTKSKVASTRPETPVTMSSTPACTSENSTPNNSILLENQTHEGEGHSVYIRNLPMDTTPEQVEEVFKKFGNIRQGGVQVRSHKVECFCFGFVEFKSLKSMEAAIEASPVMVRGRQAYVEVKKTTTRVVNGVVINGNNGSGVRERFQLERGGFRNDNYRGRSFGANMGYIRNDFKNRGELSGRGRAPTRGINGYQQKVFQNGNGSTIGPKHVFTAA